MRMRNKKKPERVLDYRLKTLWKSTRTILSESKLSRNYASLRENPLTLQTLDPYSNESKERLTTLSSLNSSPYHQSQRPRKSGSWNLPMSLLALSNREETTAVHWLSEASTLPSTVKEKYFLLWNWSAIERSYCCWSSVTEWHFYNNSTCNRNWTPLDISWLETN